MKRFLLSAIISAALISSASAQCTYGGGCTGIHPGGGSSGSDRDYDHIDLRRGIFGVAINAVGAAVGTVVNIGKTVGNMIVQPQPPQPLPPRYNRPYNVPSPVKPKQQVATKTEVRPPKHSNIPVGPTTAGPQPNPIQLYQNKP
jgi:hypothetical protein